MPTDPTSAPPPSPSSLRLFVYDSLLSGETDHALVVGEALGPARTEATFHLFDLGPYGAMISGGQTSVVGEVYAIDRASLLALDVRREVPLLFRRCAVALDDGSPVFAYVLTPEQVRGRRRIVSGDWRRRFAPAVTSAGRPWTEWAKRRRDF